MLHLSKADIGLLAHLAARDDVVGTKVRRRANRRSARSHASCSTKRERRVAYVVMRFGGLFGIGVDEYALPWYSLIYSQRLHAYEVD